MQDVGVGTCQVPHIFVWAEITGGRLDLGKALQCCASATQIRAVSLLRKARGSRAQLSAMISPRHADKEARDVVRALLDQAAVL